MRLLIDSDIFTFKAARAAETETNWGDDIWSLHMDMNEAKQAFEYMINKVQEKLGCQNVVHCFSDHSSNFRKGVDATYKGNRKGTRKPVGYVELCDWVRANNESLTKPNLEADDVMGIMATHPDNIGKSVIVSDDKDMLSIPGKVYRPMADEQIEVSEQDADRQFLTQTLTGDSVDNYPGIPGIGAVKAKAILGSRPSWGAVEQAYIKAGLTKADAIRQARLARILRWSDWDDKKSEVILWSP